jgi:hypothetical protein
MSHCPAPGIAPHQPPVGRPRKVLLICCCTSNLRRRQGGQPACRSHSASWSMSPSHTAHNSKHWLPDQLRGLVLFCLHVLTSAPHCLSSTPISPARLLDFDLD